MIAIYATSAALGALIAWWRMPVLPRASWLLAVAAGPQLLTIAGVHHVMLVVVSLFAVCLWAQRNWQLAGIWLIFVGSMLNLITMTVHGGSMPIATTTLALLEVDVPPETILAGSKDRTLAGLTGLWFLLSDWIILNLGVRIIVASPGDVLLATGIIRWLTANRKEVHP